MNGPSSAARWPELCRAAPVPGWAETALERVGPERPEVAGLDAPARAGLARVLGSSPEVGRWVATDPSLAAVLGARDLDEELSADAYARRLAAPPGGPETPETFHRRLRRARRRELVRIVAREVLGAAPVEETARELSAFAEASLAATVAWVGDHLAEAYGVPVGDDGEPNGLCLLGMGKLGGRELNLSSDVDVIALYRTGRGTTTGGAAGTLEPRAYFARAVALVVEALGRVTEDGLVWRVDLDLRPEGRSGAIAQPWNNAVLYYQSWGQTWERAALLKARPVAGAIEVGEAFLGEVEPFVYRRSLDYTTVEDLEAMKRRIDRDAGRRRGGGDDLKLGPGGIREVEFFVQTLQLIHGGTAPEVRARNTLEALRRLAGAGVVEADVTAGLAECYRFLRRLEHAVQALHFRQTHRVPTDPEELRAVAGRLGFAGAGAAEALLAAFDEVRARVRDAYGRLVHGAQRTWEEEQPVADEARRLLALEVGDPGADELLRDAGFRDPARALEGLRRLRRGPERGHPSPRAQKVLERIAPFLVAAVRGSPDPDRALQHLAEFLGASGARASYLALLEQNPPTARLLVTLFGTSDFLSRYLVTRPELLDELVLGSHVARDKSAAAMGAELRASLEASADEEEWLDAVRRFRNVEFLRIALHELWGALDPDQVGAQVSRVAGACLEAACGSAFARLAAKYGAPRQEDGAPARFAVLGLGKLGGEELDYHSDLDVVFLYSAPGSTARAGGDGGPGLSNGEFFARVAQRVLSALATRTREGIAFRTDARLRPSGQAGPLVAPLAAFDAYHRGDAQVWERQALVKLRPAAGDPELGGAALAIARSVLYGAPPRDDPRPEIDRMRSRIEREVGREAVRGVDLKAGPGGLVDVQFAVQALQLLHGWRAEELRSPNTGAALAALRRHGLLPAGRGAALAEGHEFLRRVEARLRLLRDRPTDTLPRAAAEIEELGRGLGYPGPDAGEALRREVHETRKRVRAAYDAVMRGGGR